MTHYRGPWADTPDDALHAALDEVRVLQDEYVTVCYADSYALEPLEEDRQRIDVELLYSESREQYRAVLRHAPSHVNQ